MHFLTPIDKPMNELLFTNYLDYFTLVVPMMNVQNLKNSLSTKQVGTMFVPSEHAYHYEFHKALNQLLPPPYSASSQVGGAEFAMGSARLDVLVNSNLNVGIEITAHVSLAENQQHANRFWADYKSMGLTCQCLVHFTSSLEDLNKFPYTDGNLHCVNVYHSADFSDVQLATREFNIGLVMGMFSSLLYDF